MKVKRLLIGLPAAILFFARAAQAQTDAILPPIGGRDGGQFVARCPQGQLLKGFQLLAGDDIESIRPICVVAYGPAEIRQISQFVQAFGGPESPGSTSGLLYLVCPSDAPIVTGMYIRSEGVTEVVNNLHLFCGVAAPAQSPTEFPAAVFDGPYAQDRSSGTQRCPAGLVAVGINGRSSKLLNAVGLICGAPKLTPTPPITPTTPGFAYARSIAINDFNDDAHGDILWHNASTGESQIWFMSGSSRIRRATIVEGGRPALVGPPCSIVGARDFSRDGQTDLLWYNSSSGQTQIWYMSRQQVMGRADVLGEDGSAAIVGPPWSIVGVNDMNGDRKLDIIWHNSSTGETQIWQMNGNRVSYRATVLDENGSVAFVGLPWSIVGSGDFNGDKKTDLLWYNSSTGETQIWQMNDYRVIGRATVLGEDRRAALVGPPWAIAGTNAFNNDGTADILWHNDSTGETQIWFMNGPSVVRRATVDAERDGGGAMVRQPWSIKAH